jgi:hypothetical protein
VPGAVLTSPASRACNTHDAFTTRSGEPLFRECPPMADRFFRKGRVGGWRERLSDRQVARLVDDHAVVMAELGYLDATGTPT